MSKSIVGKSIAILLGLVFVSAAGADDHSSRAMIEELLALEGQAYLDARDALLAGETEPGRLARQILEGGGYGAQAEGGASQPGWAVLVFADALAMHGTHPQEARRLLNLQGLDPEVYTRRRKPEPSALLELKRMRHVAPLMMELYLKGLGWYTWLDGATETEREILQAELLIAIGVSGYESSVPFLIEVVEDRGNLPDDVFRAAVLALGSTGSLEALPILLGVLEDAHFVDDIVLYALTVEALGKIRDVETWPHLKAELSHADPRVRVAAIRGARAYGSRWHWDHDPAQGDAMRREIGLLLVDILVGTDDPSIVNAVMASVGSLATPGLQNSLQNESGWVGGASESLGPPATPGGAEERLQRALSLVNRSLSRR